MADLIKIDLPPGLERRGTVYQTQNCWYNSGYVRWSHGNMTTIGGWSARTTTPVTGKARAIQTSQSNDSTRIIIVGTHSHLYALTPSLTTPVDITPAGFTAGRADAAAGGGYGVGLYGVGTYGTPRVDNVSVQDASMWTLALFGQYPQGVMSDDGKLYEWRLDISTPTLAAAVSGAPTGNAAVVVTPESFEMLLGAGGDPRKVQWCSQGDNTDWTPTATNTAGDFNIQSAGHFMCGKTTRLQTLLFTTLDAYIANYVGLPSVYTIDRIGENCGVISRGASVAIDSRVMWMGIDNFWMFDGSAVQQMNCKIYDAVFGDLNFVQRSKITAQLIAEHNEVWFTIPSEASTEVDTKVVYNYVEDHWSLHPLVRLVGTDAGVFNNPIMIDNSGYLYDHEIGAIMGVTPFAESGPVEIGDGETLMRVRRIIFDEQTSGDVRFSAIMRNWPNDAEVTYGPYASGNPVSVKFSGRQARQYVEFLNGGGLWGAPRFDVAQGSRR